MESQPSFLTYKKVDPISPYSRGIRPPTRCYVWGTAWGGCSHDFLQFFDFFQLYCTSSHPYLYHMPCILRPGIPPTIDAYVLHHRHASFITGTTQHIRTAHQVLCIHRPCIWGWHAANITCKCAAPYVHCASCDTCIPETTHLHMMRKGKFNTLIQR